MTVQEILADDAAIPASEAPETPIFLQGRSCDELRAIAGRGVHGGDLYFAAVKELERRAHDTEVAIEHQQVETAARRQYQLLWWAVLIGAVAVAAVARVLGF
jgi:hypothetical protein